MIIKRFFDEQLAHASYMVGCLAAGEAIVIDPNRDVAQYIRSAEEEGLRIAAITETHIHADFVSGARELAQRTGGKLYLSNEGGTDWRYEYAGTESVSLLEDGDEIVAGSARLTAMHTPGHTPEHLSFLVQDELAGGRLTGAFTGDFLFVGDVGRPDLLETAAKIEGAMREGARQLHLSLQRFRTLPSEMLVWPAHGAGSSCGKALGGVPDSSLGLELMMNWAFQVDNEDEFIERVLKNQPEPPLYFANMKRVNREGPHPGTRLSGPPLFAVSRLKQLVSEGATVVDLRPRSAVEAAFIKGTLLIPYERSFSSYAGSLLSPDDQVYLIAEDESRANEAAMALAKIGIDGVLGWFSSSVAVKKMDTQLFPSADSGAFNNAAVEAVDVRKASEREESALESTRHIPLARLRERYEELPKDRPIVVHCAAGNRALVAASFLRMKGYDASFYAGEFQALESEQIHANRSDFWVL